MRRSPAYREPSDLEIYSSDGKLIHVKTWARNHAPKPDQIANPRKITDTIFPALVLGAALAFAAGLIVAFRFILGGHA